MECNEQSRCIELAKASTFYRAVYSEIEEVGWEHLVRFSADLTSLSFRILDSKGRVHVMEIQLDKTHPTSPPSVSADVPYLFNIKWSSNSRLKDVVQQFRKHLERLQTFWSTLDDIDRSLRVVEHKQASPAGSNRQISIGNDCFIMLSINATDPKSLPECRFIGSGQIVNLLRDRWRRNSNRWGRDKKFLDNLERILETQLPRPVDVEKNDQELECGICYAHSLPVDDELRDKSGTGTDYTCDNTSCKRTFHSICLMDWLCSITTTRQSFNVLFGSCPYCSEPVAVKINSVKK
ncbi:PREDICTED: E3 ubiquitin-protein ligase FANCL isoform X1 [Fragaria vesca subsp. vesca]|uniref:E3 ubiquitin-protein ligase FANCL isoform X1 n=2 Tax=Fragaria vesca subsp. vesca TaxID=101020 RepID=UPI0002C34C31|nr:PREDICTED: E3 ubiquitin-protein ligase FANCL isoform X1 [Fragaria vesca subsp. vesca]